MKKYTDLVNDILPSIQEAFPWDVDSLTASDPDMLIVDIREPYEFEQAHIPDSINVPRGILESACDWGYDETVPELARARDRSVLLVCKSGSRSALAAFTMQLMGYGKVKSLKTGLRGWNDDEQPLVDALGNTVDPDHGEAVFANRVMPEQMGPSD